MSVFRPLRTLEPRQALSGADNDKHMIIQTLGQFTSIELIACVAQEEPPASESMDVEASAARIFNEKAVFVRAHRPAPLRTIRQLDCGSTRQPRQAGVCFRPIADIPLGWHVVRVFPVIAASVLLALTSPLFGQTDAEVKARLTPDVRACESAPANGGTFQQAMCYGAEAQRQDKRLNETWVRVIADVPPSRRAALRRGERAWIEQRDKNCLAEKRGYVNSTANYMFAVCMAEASIRRTLWLEHLNEKLLHRR